MANNGKKMNRIVLINIFSTILLNGITLLTAPLFSRMLGAGNYGISSIYLTWVSVFSACLSLQTGSTLNMAKNRFPGEDRQYQSSVLAASLLSFLVGFLVVLAFLSPISAALKMEPLMILLLIFHAYGSFCVSFLNSKNTMDFRAAQNLVLSGAVTIGTVILSYIFIKLMPSEINYWGRIGAMSGVYGVLGVGITAYFLRTGKILFSKKYWKFCLPLSIPIIFHILANLVLGQCDRVMLQQMLSTEAVGIYSLAATFSSIMSAIWGALNNSWSPFYHQYAGNGEEAEIRVHGRNYLELYTVLAIGFLLLTPEVFHVFADETYWSGTNIIPFLVMGHYFVFLYSFPVNHEFFNCQTKMIPIATMLASICNIVLNLLLISKMGAVGAAVATMIAHGLQFLFHHFTAIRIKSPIAYSFGIKVLLPYCLATMLVMLWTVAMPGNWIVRWGVGVMLGIYELKKIIRRKAIF